MTPDEEEGALSPEEEEPQFELSPEKATSLAGGARPGILNRKRILIAICVTFSLIIGGGLILSSFQTSKKKAAERELSAGSASNNSDFLNSLQNRAIYNSRRESAQEPQAAAGEPEAELPEPLLPPASFGAPREPAPEPPRQAPPPPPAPGQGAQQPQAAQQQPEPTYFKSPLVPAVQGRLFAQAQQPQPEQTAAAQPAPYYAAPNYAAQNAFGAQASGYAQQNAQDDKRAFYDSSSGGSVSGGLYLGDNSLWVGTVIPAVLETAINTDLPGNVLARVSQNVYDSKSGKLLLVPQGTVLVARYNSSVSYAQSRVQIVWDALIRPDGYMVELEGANGVDRAGMSGQAAERHENWFEYLKAAGVITLFTIANSSLTEAASKDPEDELAASVALANSQTVSQLGSNVISRALDIQPTLTVENGTPINVMLNKTLYLPPLDGPRASQKYKLE